MSSETEHASSHKKHFKDASSKYHVAPFLAVAVLPLLRRSLCGPRTLTTTSTWPQLQEGHQPHAINTVEQRCARKALSQQHFVC